MWIHRIVSVFCSIISLPLTFEFSLHFSVMVWVQATMSSKPQEAPVQFAMIICLILQNYTASIFSVRNVSQFGLTGKKHAPCVGHRCVEKPHADMCQSLQVFFSKAQDGNFKIGRTETHILKDVWKWEVCKDEISYLLYICLYF